MTGESSLTPDKTESDRVQSVLDHQATKTKKVPKSGAKHQLWLSVDPEVYEWFKAQGEDWKRHMTEALRKAAGYQ